MQIWELRYDGMNEHAVLIPVDDEFDLLSVFSTDGKRKDWGARPNVEPSQNKRKKKPDPRADLTYLVAGAITLNEKAYQALRDFLLPFGQLLEMDCNGEIEYFYNVTYLINCIDYEHSTKEFNAVTREVFLPGSVRDDVPLIFKDPHTAGVSIYLNQAAKEKFEQLAAAAGLFGARFVEAGRGII